MQFLTTLKILGGCLLLIIPGIYWSYCYVLVPYLLAENPYLTTRRAMELSRQMMDGEKWSYFVLRLSFFGWGLLCLLTFASATTSWPPTSRPTMAEFYAAMRAKALSAGFSTTEELGGFVRHDSGSF